MNEELVEITLSCGACWRTASLLLLLYVRLLHVIHYDDYSIIAELFAFEVFPQHRTEALASGGGRTSRNGLQQQARKRRTCLSLTALGGLGFRI